jgi:hypothetical protein
MLEIRSIKPRYPAADRETRGIPGEPSFAMAATEVTPISISLGDTLGHSHEHRQGMQMNDAGAAARRFWGCRLREPSPSLHC